jgi:hypothetical protein
MQTCSVQEEEEEEGHWPGGKDGKAGGSEMDGYAK